MSGNKRRIPAKVRNRTPSLQQPANTLNETHRNRNHGALNNGLALPNPPPVNRIITEHCGKDGNARPLAGQRPVGPAGNFKSCLPEGGFHETLGTQLVEPHCNFHAGPWWGVLVSGCAGSEGATTGAVDAGSTSLAAKPIASGHARLKVTRINTILYAGAPATLNLNGKKIADLWAGKTTFVDVPASKNVLSASAWSYPGTFKVGFDTTAGQTYAVEVAPRMALFGPGTLLGPLGGVLDASVNENAGAFQMRFTGAHAAGAGTAAGGGA